MGQAISVAEGAIHSTCLADHRRPVQLMAWTISLGGLGYRVSAAVVQVKLHLKIAITGSPPPPARGLPMNFCLGSISFSKHQIVHAKRDHHRWWRRRRPGFDGSQMVIDIVEHSQVERPAFVRRSAIS